MDRYEMMLSGADYHWRTAYDRYKMGGHLMDWAHQPVLFKTYPGIEAVPLPSPSGFPETSLWSLVAPCKSRPTSARLDSALMARLLHLAGGITAKSGHAEPVFYFRTNASAGALYPTEIYTGIFDDADPQPGIYHFGTGEFALTPLRRGCFDGCLNTIRRADDPHPQGSFFLTAIFFRSAWKYRSRAFRYVLLDTGHLLENLLLALASEALPFTCHYDFSDEDMGRLIGLDNRREAALVWVDVLGGSCDENQPPGIVAPLSAEVLAASRVSQKEIDYDDILNAYRAGFQPSGHGSAAGLNAIGLAPTTWIPIEKSAGDDEERTFVQSVHYRRSKRNYAKQPLAKNKLTRLLDLLCRSHGQSGVTDRFAGLTVGFLTGLVDGFDSGFYLLDPENRRVGLVATGSQTAIMASVCLDQKWLANAAVHFLFMANLPALDSQYGPRGYRYAMLNAGRLGQLIYLGATALGLGCCGIGALYDWEAQQLLHLNDDTALLYLVAAGPVKR